MQVAYHKGWSGSLGRDMEYKRFGHAGRPVVMFPTSRGRFFQYEDSGMIAALSEFIDAGRIQVWTLDGIDAETFFGDDPDLQNRIARHEAYFRYVREEALPEILGAARGSNAGPALKPLFSGCSMGAFHAANFVFRFPELTAGVIALSGVYSTRDFFGPALGGGIYFNSPLDYLAGLSDEGILEKLRSLRLYFCCGQGAWEERMIVETRRLDDILRDRKIPAWVDFWGTDVSHDWQWWHRQLVYFMGHWLDDDAKRQVA
jgi:esterase/lipase superfamily enzyme